MMWWADDGWQRGRVCQSVGRCGRVEQVCRQRMAAGTESASQIKDCASVADGPVDRKKDAGCGRPQLADGHRRGTAVSG